MSKPQQPRPPQGPMRDQVMPHYAFPPATAGSTITVKQAAGSQVSVLVNGRISH